MSKRTLKGVEVFAAGTWKGKPWTTADLDAIVDNFRKFQAPTPLKTRLQKAPAVVGHTEKDLANSAVHRRGEVVNLYRDGAKLKADVDDIDEPLAAAIESRNYDDVSAELYRDPPEGIREHGAKGPMFRRLAILGGDIPHVKGLNVDGLAAKLSPAQTFAERANLPKVTVCRTVRRGDEYETFSEEVVMTREEMLAVCAAAGCKTEIVDAFSDEQLAEIVKIHKPAGSAAATATAVPVTFSEDQIKAVVAELAKPIKAELDASLEATREAAKRQRIDVFCETELNAGRIEPADLDPKAGPTLAERLMKLDDSAKIFTFTEGGVARELTALDAEMRAIRLRPRRYESNGRKVASGKTVIGGGAADGVNEDLARVVSYAESHADDIERMGQTKESFVEMFKLANPENKQLILDGLPA